MPESPSHHRRIVVAGATGYLGKHVVESMHRSGWRVRALARDPARLGAAARFCDELFVGEATQESTLDGLFEGAEAAFSSIGIRHLRRSPTFEEVDFHANALLVRLAEKAGVERFVFVSILDGDRLRHASPLVDARERVVDLLGATSMTTTVLRPTGFFNDMAEYLEMARRGRVWLIGSGKTRINPIHGADLAEITSRLLSEPGVRSQVSVGGPNTLTQREVGELAFRVLGRRPRFGHIPPGLVRFLASVIRPFNTNAAALARMFAELGDHDAVAPSCGSHGLEEFFRELAARSHGEHGR